MGRRKGDRWKVLTAVAATATTPEGARLVDLARAVADALDLAEEQAETFDPDTREIFRADLRRGREFLTR